MMKRFTRTGGETMIEMGMESEIQRLGEMMAFERKTAEGLYSLARSFRRPCGPRLDAETEQELSEIEVRLERLMGGFRCRSP